MRRVIPAVVLPFMLVGCGGESAPSAAPQEPAPAASAPAQPQTEEAVREAAQEHVDAYVSGDYAGAWESWSNSAKKVLDQAGYVRLNELCPQLAEGVPMKVDAVRLNAAKTVAVVRFERLGFKFSYKYLYEDGRWRFQPDAETIADYRLGAEALAAKRKREGSCG